MHLAIGTSLVVMVVTALYTTVLRHRRGDLDWTLFWRIAPRVVIGAALGHLCRPPARPGPSRILHRIRDLHHCRALHRRYGAAVKSADSRVAQAPPSPRVALPYGSTESPRACAVLCSGLEQPSLSCLTSRRAVPEPVRIGDRRWSFRGYRRGCGVGYVAGGLNETDLPAAALGYLYLPAFAGLSGGALIASALGVMNSHSLDEDIQFCLSLGYLTVVLGVMIMR